MGLADPLGCAGETWAWPTRLGAPEEHGPGRPARVRRKNMGPADPLGCARRTWAWPTRSGAPEEQGPGRPAR
eukprot:1457908-Alexandrium_andersonii.AAC.1